MPLADELEKPTPGNANHSVTPICDSYKTRTDIRGLLHLTVSIEPKGCRSRDLLDGMSSVEIYELFLGVVKRDFLCNLLDKRRFNFNSPDLKFNMTLNCVYTVQYTYRWYVLVRTIVISYPHSPQSNLSFQ